MSNSTAFREIERKLAESLEKHEASKRSHDLREKREFSDELKALMKRYRVSALDVLAILDSRTVIR